MTALEKKNLEATIIELEKEKAIIEKYLSQKFVSLLEVVEDLDNKLSVLKQTS